MSTNWLKVVKNTTYNIIGEPNKTFMIEGTVSL